MTDPETYDEWRVRTEPSPEFRQRLMARGRVQGAITFMVLTVFVLRINGGPLWWVTIGAIAGAVILRDVLIYRGAPTTGRRVVTLSAIPLAALLVAAVPAVPWPFTLIAIAALLAADWFSEPRALRHLHVNH